MERLLYCNGRKWQYYRKLRPLIAEGFSIAVFPEGERPESGDTKIKRFHKSAFHIADALGLDVVPVFL